MHIAYGYTGEGKKPVKGGGVTYAPRARKKFEVFLQDAADVLHEMPFYRWLRERRLYNSCYPPKAGQRCPKTSHRRRKTGAVLPKIGGPNRHKAHPRLATMFRNRLRTAEDRPTLAPQTG